MSESESGELHFNPPGKDDERMQLVGAEKEFKGSIDAQDLAHFDKLYRRNKKDKIEKEYARFAAKKIEELDDLKKRGKISEWTYGINEQEIKGLGYITEAISAQSADEQAIAVIALLAGNSREKNHPQTKEHHTFYKDKLFESDASQYFIDKEGEVHYSFMGARNFHSLALRGLHIVRRATADSESSKLEYLIDQYNAIAHPEVNKRTEIALGLLEVVTVLGASYSKERALADHLGKILVQQYVKERNPSIALLEIMGQDGLAENTKRWLKAEYFNPYCIGSVNDFVWSCAAHFDLMSRTAFQEYRTTSGGYEVMSPTFVKQWHQQIDSPRGLRFLIRDRADKETGMGQGAVMRYDLDDPGSYFQDKAKYDEQLALLGMGIDVKKERYCILPMGLKDS